MTRNSPKPRAAAVVLAAALAWTSLMALAPSAALAVPAGGYADLVELVSPSVVFIEVTGVANDDDFNGELP